MVSPAVDGRTHSFFGAPFIVGWSPFKTYSSSNAVIDGEKILHILCTTSSSLELLQLGTPDLIARSSMCSNIQQKKSVLQIRMLRFEQDWQTLILS